ncbi:MAG: interleukin-like EMT inducer domain-containing protein [Bryobacteraceae bacterium]
MNAPMVPRLKRLALALLWLAVETTAAGEGPRLVEGIFRLENRPFHIRGISYNPRLPASAFDQLSAQCQLARDLPLIAAAGANTVRTQRLSRDDEPVLTSLLETTGLYWLAGFSLEPYYDPEVPIEAKKAQILEDLRGFAERHLQNERLLAFVIGEDVAEDYDSKFAGAPSEFYSLLAEAAASLRAMRPEDPPLLATVVRKADQLQTEVPGLSFWIWKISSWKGALPAAEEAASAASAPVLVEGFLDQLPKREEQPDKEETVGDPVAAVLEAIRELGGAKRLLGFLYARFAEVPSNQLGTELFRREAEEGQWESLTATRFYEALGDLWEGRRHDEWRMGEASILQAIVHAAHGGNSTAAGGLAKLQGTALAAHVYAANGVPWPLHHGETCLCVGGRPLRLGMIGPDSGTVLIPWEMEVGDHEAVYYRAGRATGPVRLRVEPLAPGLFTEVIARENDACLVSSDNGIRPGETVTLYGTGFGPGDPLEVTPKVYVNGKQAEVLEAGLMLSVPGIARIRIRVDPATPPSAQGYMVAESGLARGTAGPVRIEPPSSRYGVRVEAERLDALVQAGGLPARLVVRLEGRNGYCGPIAVEALDLPDGVSGVPVAAATGEVAVLELRAAPEAQPQQAVPFRVRAWAREAEPAEIEAKITVLPSRGPISLSALSNGFRSRYPRAQFRWNGQVIFDTVGGGPGRGINVLAVNSATGAFGPVRTFDTWGDEAASAELVSYLNSLPDGALVMFAVADEGTRLLSAEARGAIARMFFSRYIWGLDYQQSWALIGRKGWWPFSENWSPTYGIGAFTNASFPLP